jgi:DNA processing protein
LGGGLDHVYPAQNEEIYLRIASDGLLISERPLGVIAKAKDFPRRNRIISGISHGTIVIEAAMRSGSLTTARFASEQGREVFAVPGHPLDPRATGTNKLIQNGANLITNSVDVLESLRPQLSDQDCYNQTENQTSGFQEQIGSTLSIGEKSTENLAQFETSDEDLKARVLELLGPTPIERDTLVRLLKCNAKDLQIVLLDLDLEGLIEHHGQQRLSLSS